MTTLDDLLALLPDNDQGLISAQDLRDVVTGLWNATVTAQEDVANTDARVDAMEAAAGSGRTAGVTYRLNTTPSAVPQSGELVSDTGGLETATVLKINRQSRDGRDLSSALIAATKITCQDYVDAAAYVHYGVGVPVTVSGNYFIVPVTVLDSSGVIAGGSNDIATAITWTAGG